MQEVSETCLLSLISLFFSSIDPTFDIDLTLRLVSEDILWYWWTLSFHVCFLPFFFFTFNIVTYDILLVKQTTHACDDVYNIVSLSLMLRLGINVEHDTIDYISSFNPLISSETDLINADGFQEIFWKTCFSSKCFVIINLLLIIASLRIDQRARVDRWSM